MGPHDVQATPVHGTSCGVCHSTERVMGHAGSSVGLVAVRPAASLRFELQQVPVDLVLAALMGAHTSLHGNNMWRKTLQRLPSFMGGSVRWRDSVRQTASQRS